MSSDFKEEKLPSGAVLKIGVIPFGDAKNLYQTLLEENKAVKLLSKDEVVNLIKDVFCHTFASKKVEAALLPCLQRCTYNGVKIDIEKTFEPESARQDYMKVCALVGKHAIDPFLKSLYADFLTALKAAENFQA